MVKVSFKITGWESIIIPDNIKEEVISKIRSGEIQTSNDLFAQYEGDVTFEGLDMETEQQLSVGENDGFATLEVADGDNILYANGKS